MKSEIELTADGSHTLFVSELDEHYHSVNGAVQESKHIFIDAGLHNCKKDTIRIFEVGFGTGLNAYLTVLDIQKKQIEIHYVSIEAYPLSIDLVKKLNYPQQIDENTISLYHKLHEAEWEREIEITPNFYLHKIEGDFTIFDMSQLESVDVVYFDAFAPEKQVDMWSQELFDKLYNCMNDDATLVTYCAKGIVRRMLQQSGFTVERLSGPIGKREILRAIKK